jgi:3-oxoadipate enol-lactonase
MLSPVVGRRSSVVDKKESAILTQSHRGQVTVSGTQLSYQVAGDGPALVLMHAGIADNRMWDDQWDEFSQHFRTIRYDVRGFGKSANPDGPFGHDEDLHALLQHLGVEQASFVAVSMAGHIALNYILGHPSKANALVLVASGVGAVPPSADLVRAWKAVEEAVVAGDMARVNEIEMQIWVDGPSRTPDQVDPRVRQRVSEMNANNLRMENERAEEREADPSVKDRLAEIAIPTLVIVGDLDQPHVIESADLFVRDISGARKVVMPGTAHLPSMEQPAVFNRLVLHFLLAIHNQSTTS